MALWIRHQWTFFACTILALAGIWIACTAILSPGTTQGATPAPHAGFSAPDFELKTLQGGQIRLSQFAGQPVIVNLWASWCPPCKAEMPALQAVHLQFKDAGLVVLGINLTSQDSTADVIKFINENNLSFPILLDEQGVVAQLYQNRSLPSTFFINRKGIIRNVIIGGPISESTLSAEALRLINEDR